MENNDLIKKNIENDYLDDPNYLYHLETFDLPYGCPYRQMVPFGPNQGPGFGPQGPGFGPQGPGFGPQGPGFGPQGPGFGPQGPGMGQPQSSGQQGAPSSAPPNFTPSKSTKSAQGQGVSTTFVDQGAIRPCVFRFIYIWPTRGNGFWAWLTYVGRRSVAGFQWNGRRWVYFGMDLRRIDSFQCV